MITRKEDALREDFRKLLRDLALKQDLLKDATGRVEIYKRLEDIYVPLENGKIFRHYYSDIFSELIKIRQNPEMGDIEIVGQNLGIVKKWYDPDKATEDVSDSVNKLYDHVSLEIARISYSDAGDRNVSQEGAVASIEAKVVKLEQESEQVLSGIRDGVAKAIDSQSQIQKELVEQKEEIGRQQREYISILGIFASIVLAFTTGIAFSTSVLENINAVSVYRMIIVVLIIGLVLVNTMYGLFYYIDRLVIRASKKTIKPLLITEGIFLTLILCTVVCWSIGVVEKRNDRVNSIDSKIVHEQNIENMEVIDETETSDDEIREQ